MFHRSWVIRQVLSFLALLLSALLSPFSRVGTTLAAHGIPSGFLLTVSLTLAIVGFIFAVRATLMRD